MSKIELYKRVVLTANYEQESLDGTTVYKKGTKGFVIDFCDNPSFVIVELDSNEYIDNMPAIPVNLLEYI